jgi:alkylmercury lyase
MSNTSAQLSLSTESHKMDIQALANRVNATFPPLSERGRRIAIATHRILAQGKPVPDYAIAAATGLDVHDVKAEMKDWSSINWDDHGRIVGFLGLSLSGTLHQFEVGGVELCTWCAWDTLFLPELLGQSATVRSPCGQTGEMIELQVTPDQVSSSHPELVLSFVDPDSGCVEGDQIVSTFCCHIHFFKNRETGEAWKAEQGDETLILALDEAFELARTSNLLRYGTALTAALDGTADAAE